MNVNFINSLLERANTYYILSLGAEKLPAPSDNLKVILKNLESLETYTARKKYAENNLERLSSGSSRIAYLTGTEIVIKLAKNDKGIAQNEAEINATKKFPHAKYLNKVLSGAKNFSWIKFNFLEKITEKEFEEFTDFKFDDFGNSMRYALREISSSVKKKPKKYDEISKLAIFKELKKIAQELDLMPGDLAKISSYGKKDNHPVLIDAGLTKQVFEDFYESGNSTDAS